jgi:hypothetical protein
MFIKNFIPRFISFSNSFVNVIKKQDRQMIISCLACGILLLGATYWACSRFWSPRRVRKALSSKEIPNPNLKNDNKNNNPKKSPQFSPVKLDRDDVERKEEEDHKEESIKDKIGGNLSSIQPLEEKNENLSLDVILDDEEDQEKILGENVKKVGPIRNPSSPIPVSICIDFLFCNSAREAGLDADLDEEILLKLEDNSPILLKKGELLLPVRFFNLPEGVEISGLDNIIDLPESLFENKEENSILRLVYGDQLLELHIHQKKRERLAEHSFQETIALVKEIYAELKYSNPPILLYPDDIYSAEGGTIYKLFRCKENVFQLKAVSNDNFRPLHGLTDPIIDLMSLPVDVLRMEDKTILLMDLVGFDGNSLDDLKGLEGIEFVLNDDLLMIHILQQPKLEIDLKNDVVDKKEGDTNDVVDKNDEVVDLPPPERRNEFITHLEWKKLFTETSIDQMKAKLEKAQLIILNGQLQINLPTNT